MKILKEPAARATLAFVIVAVALIVALWPRGGPDDTADGGGTTAATSTSGVTDQQVSEDELSKERAAAALQPCPDGTGPAGPHSVLAGVTVPCMATGAPVDLGVTTAGKPLVINMWAVWCLPCRRELPIFDQFSKDAGESLNVLAVHASQGGDKPYFVLKFLQEVGVHLPVVTDPNGAVAKAIGAPRVFPSTVLIRSDGTVADVLPRVFDSEAQLAEVVREKLGVDVGGAQ